MTAIQIYLTLGVFAGVILLIALNWLDMTLAVLLGASVLMACGILTQADIMRSLGQSEGMIALLFEIGRAHV